MFVCAELLMLSLFQKSAHPDNNDIEKNVKSAAARHHLENDLLFFVDNKTRQEAFELSAGGLSTLSANL